MYINLLLHLQRLNKSMYVLPSIIFLGVGQICFFLDTDDETNSTMMQLNFCAPRTLMRGVLPGKPPHSKEDHQCLYTHSKKEIVISTLGRVISCSCKHSRIKLSYGSHTTIQ